MEGNAVRPDLQRQSLEAMFAGQTELADAPQAEPPRSGRERASAPENRSDGIDELENRIENFESGLKSLQGDAQRISRDIEDAHAIARSLARRL